VKIPICSFLVVAPLFLAPFTKATADLVSATATTNATVRPGGPRSGSSGIAFFNVQGSNAGSNASWGVLDFSVDAFNLDFPVTDVATLTLDLTESNASFTVGNGGLAFYLTTDTTTSIAAGSSPLVFDADLSPEGLGTQLGTLGTSLFALGTGTFSSNTGNTGSGTLDSYPLTLSGDALDYFIDQLNTDGATLRLVVTPTDLTGASTWAGATNTTTSWRPSLSFEATLDQPTLVWIGGSGTWNDTGGTDWSGGPWQSTKTAVFNSGGGVVTLGTPITAVGLAFNVDGYTVAGDHPLTLSSSPGGNVVAVSPPSATATLAVELAGTAGLVLAGANSFTGAVTINGGVLAVSSDGNFGDTANGIVLNLGTLKNTTALTVAATRTLSGSGTLDASAGNLVFEGPVNAASLSTTPASHVTFAGSSASFTTATLGAGSTLVIDAPFTGSSRTTISGDATIALNGDNSGFSGGYTFSRGTGTFGPTVVLAGPSALGTGEARPNAGALQAAVPLTGDDAITTPISMGGSVTFSGENMEFSGGFAFFGSFAKTMTVENDVTITTSIAPDTFSTAVNTLIKDGTGTLTLTALNGYDDGTQILDGAIIVTAGGSLGIGSVTISPTALLRLDTETGIDDGSTLSLFSSGEDFATLDLNFDASLAEVVHSLFIDGVPMEPGTYTSADLPDFLVGDGQLVVVAVPEPRTILLGLAAAAVLLGVRRSRRV
jgi:autotransporter-associated beta strand protein